MKIDTQDKALIEIRSLRTIDAGSPICSLEIDVRPDAGLLVAGYELFNRDMQQTFYFIFFRQMVMVLTALDASSKFDVISN